uniref:glutamate-5-semialdehyde dehydrogenase n=1 Tax=Chromera velia CCMP2878 TaxID=1169474 RepID=A0A0G4H0F8_9ALVE|mmetsp:Transcript_21557/g.42828  ORF Transcript_21557/g.42828 Transcript_21557/m.42828 type:complete len:460 (-) Transcript_21557:507-1886(-)|eukprot:Cvel_24191.t1-p1 / transcript=Cvel_24191.t1 / gene=Cvel_24191 / organism=Chromera_velia_CCMP2878 / gene_product=Probable gamma-glutamyl phosphate reductase, putative / transcript_product=Probable gamma-glutamyl phosphate reductase, putative / location=Cvel_scaffold2583:23288-25286(+) / protein_length=459 / sequence_SO=supercontig / SO=protein_coding / is_pseudo=false
MESFAQKARVAAQQLAAAPLDAKNGVLQLFKEELTSHRPQIEAANAQDKEAAKKATADGSMSSSLFKRLDVTGAKFDTLLKGIDDVINLEDPVGKCQFSSHLSDGLDLYRVSCPIGVLAIIFEARPEAAVQISSLAIKSGNALILKGGKEATHSNHAINVALSSALKKAHEKWGIPLESVQLIDTREEVNSILKMDKYIDLVIPRGGNALVSYIKNNTSIPVLGHADGICSVFVDESAELGLALDVVQDSKLNYVAACNALETLLVHKDMAPKFLPQLAGSLLPLGVTFKADETALPLLLQGAETGEAAKSKDKVQAATAEDFDTEFLCETMAVKVVGTMQEAIDHINLHGSHHTDCIVSADSQNAERFMTAVDSAGVYHNASTRFADGFRYGFGAEVGISTNRIHSRGPVGLEGLVIYKYRLYGKGHTVAAFNSGERQYSHKTFQGPPDVEKIAELHN